MLSMPGRIAVVLFSMLLAWTAIAETVPSDPLVGRVNHAGYNRHSHCTGFLVEGGHLVTAAHCMPSAERAVHYLAGYDRGQFLRHVERPRSRFRKVPGRDIAVLCNADADQSGRRVSSHLLQPAQTVQVLGYAAPRSQVLQSKSCEVIRTSERSIQIGCPLSPGNSGGPVIAAAGGQPSVVGVVSATSLHSGIAHRLKPGDLDICD